jgi:hypothetical protein
MRLMSYRLFAILFLATVAAWPLHAQEQSPTPTQDALPAPEVSPTPTQDALPTPEVSPTPTQDALQTPEVTPSQSEQAAPAQPEQQEPRKSYLPVKDSYKVFVFGDYLAGGLSAGMSRLNVGNPEIKLGVRFKEDSGIARPEFYDWNEAIPKIIESNAVDIAIIFVGTNDSQAMTDGIERLEFGTPPWTALYSREVDRLINTLKQGGVAVYWVSLPPMAAPSYDAAIAQIADIQKRQAEAASIRYIDLRPELTGEDGKMLVRGPDDTGGIRKLRDNDGVSFMKVGNNKIGKLVLDALNSDIALARSNTPSTIESSSLEGGGAIKDQESLLSGSAAAAGVDPAEGGKSDAGPGGKTDFALRGAITQPAPESPAKRLFKYGEAPPPVAGRFDDFSFTE